MNGWPRQKSENAVVAAIASMAPTVPASRYRGPYRIP